MLHRFTSSRRAFALVVLALTPTVAFAAFQATGSSRVTFTATGTAGLRIVGTITELSVVDDGTSVTVTVPLAHLSTGIGLRDTHTKETLDVEHHGTAALVVSRASLAIPTTSSVRTEARGTMRIRGQTHEIPFRYKAERRADGVHVEGTAQVDVTDFGIAQPSYLGVRVNKQVEIAATFVVVDR